MYLTLEDPSVQSIALLKRSCHRDRDSRGNLCPSLPRTIGYRPG